MSDSLAFRLAQKLRPDLKPGSDLTFVGRLIDLYSLFLSLPLAALALLWLLASTNPALSPADILTLLLLLGIDLLFLRYQFIISLEIVTGSFASVTGSLQGLIWWSAALIFGPTALWIGVIDSVVNYVFQSRRESNVDLRWNNLRAMVDNIATVLLSGLAGLTVYGWLGGEIPLQGLGAAQFWPAAAATLVAFSVPFLLVLPFMLVMRHLFARLGETTQADQASLTRFVLAGLALAGAALPFAILAAGMYSRHGLAIYLFFMAGAFLVSLLANRLSRITARSEQRSRELAALEALGRAIIAAPVDLASLHDLLETHIPAMFPQMGLYIWLEPAETLYQTKANLFARLPPAQALLRHSGRAYERLPKMMLPEQREGVIVHEGVVVAIRADDGTLLGGIYMVVRRDVGDVMEYVPAIQSLAALLASVHYRVQAYALALAGERMTRELEVAGQIQASFLPRDIPALPGWSMAATLIPARQTSGDFYDFIPLGPGRVGILVADVADKGTGAALYMALSRTVIRHFALQYPDDPARVLAEANERILADTDAEQFVTLFYGILEAEGQRLTYANGGHNPALLVAAPPAGTITPLPHTGIPLGMFPGMTWHTAELPVAPGDLLVVYTDGVTEARSADKALFGEARLAAVVRHDPGRGADELSRAIQDAVAEFVGAEPQSDDITLLVVRRERAA